MYEVILTRQAAKDLEKLKRAGFARNIIELTEIVANNPYQNPPPFEKLIGDLRGYYSRRINDKHRFVYNVMLNSNNRINSNGDVYKGIVHVLRMWSHYE